MVGGLGECQNLGLLNLQVMGITGYHILFSRGDKELVNREYYGASQIMGYLRVMESSTARSVYGTITRL